jgi:hypothetical protein
MAKDGGLAEQTSAFKKRWPEKIALYFFSMLFYYRWNALPE